MGDPSYAEDVVNGDIHTTNQNAAGLPTRDQAKTFIYALLYGGGAGKIGSIIGKGAEAGQELKDTFFSNLPALGELISQCQLKATKCTLSLSFNNDGPLGSFFRYIGDTGTYIARYDDLVDGREAPIDLSGVAVSNNGIELIDREFVAAIQDGREPNSSFQQGLAAMQVMQKLEDQMGVLKV